METYYAEVRLRVRLEAFDQRDAQEALDDHFAPGEDTGIEILDTEYLFDE